MKCTILLVMLSTVGACGSVGSTAATADAGATTDGGGAPGDGPGMQRAPGDLVWAQSTSALDPLRVQIGAGGLVIAGQLNAPAVIGNNTMIPAGDYDMGIAGFNPDDGAVLYAVRFGDVGYEAGFVDTIGGDGAPIIHGITSGTVNVGTGQKPGGGGSDTFIGRYAAAGPPAWLVRLATADEDKIQGTSPGPNGTVWATGYFVNTATIGATTLTTANHPTPMLLQFNTATGALTLASQLTTGGIAEGSSVAWRPGHVFIAGEFTSTLTTSAATLTSAGGLDAYVVALDDNAQALWARSFGGTGNDDGPVVKVDDNGDAFIAGTYQNQIAFGAVNLASQGSDDIYLAKLRGSDGATEWATSIGSTGSDNVLGLAVGPGGIVCVAGSAAGALDIGGGNQGGLDAFIACYDGTAHLRWKRLFGTAGDDRGWGLTFGSDGMLYATLTVSGPIDLGVPLMGQANPAGLLLKIAP